MQSKEGTMKNALGGLFMVGLPGTELDDSTRDLINRYGINNFILFKRNAENPEQIRTLCLGLAEACRAAGLGAPLISIDQEGGTVARLKGPDFTEFPDARVLAESEQGEELLVDYARTCAKELLAVGINMNLAPVLDVSPAGLGLFMERRSLGGIPEQVARLGALVIATMQENGLAACAKHFPGLGGATLDPHEVLPVVDRSLEELRGCDLVPFAAAIRAGVAGVMTSHTVYPQLDPEFPATLSPRILGGVLRDELGYDGMVVTDDLEMGAIENEGTVADAALVAFKAGADMLLICHEHAKIIAAHELLSGAVGGEVSEERVRRSLERIGGVRRRFAGD
ncbi:MAG: beta-N-acetylhexosaminidase [Proteobacteria bacterium]|nr:beta-N-acetylhexosaminidase [Pseudomonadota bacterium]MBU1545982.1 beta-N-acetylhexosaminidase [Pseudomonadota bacterium]MBU2619422.1 beta-N-acetylhexosaminidase [Pseudomonadota bacterium]